MVAGEERREAVENVGEPVRNRRETDLCRKADKLEHHVQRLEQAPGRDAQHERAEQGLEEEGRVVLRGSRGGDDFYLFSDVRIRRRCRAPNGRCVSKRVRCFSFFPASGTRETVSSRSLEQAITSTKTLTSSRRSGAAAVRTFLALRPPLLLLVFRRCAVAEIGVERRLLGRFFGIAESSGLLDDSTRP